MSSTLAWWTCRAVDGQVQGAIAHSMGAALFETLRYDENGNLLTPNYG